MPSTFGQLGTYPLEFQDFIRTKNAFHGRNGSFQLDIAIPKGKGVEVDAVQGRESELGFPRQGALEADLFN